MNKKIYQKLQNLMLMSDENHYKDSVIALLDVCHNFEMYSDEFNIVLDREIQDKYNYVIKNTKVVQEDIAQSTYTITTLKWFD